MYGQGSFNPQYRHGPAAPSPPPAPPPPPTVQPFPPQAPMPSQQFPPQMPLPPPFLAARHTAPTPPVTYQHGQPRPAAHFPPQSQPYSFVQPSTPYPRPMPLQPPIAFVPQMTLPMPPPPPQASYQPPPHLATTLPPPPPPPNFAPRNDSIGNARPPSQPPPPPPPLPPSSPPPMPTSPPPLPPAAAVVEHVQLSDTRPIIGGCPSPPKQVEEQVVRNIEAVPNLENNALGASTPVSDDSDMDMEEDNDLAYDVSNFNKEPVVHPQSGGAGTYTLDESLHTRPIASKLPPEEADDSRFLQDLSPLRSWPGSAECVKDIDVLKSVSDVSSLANDFSAANSGQTKSESVIVGGSPFQLIQGYASDDSEDEKKHAGDVHTIVAGFDFRKNKELGHQNHKDNRVGSQKQIDAGANTDDHHVSEQNDQRLPDKAGFDDASLKNNTIEEAEKHQPEDANYPVKQNLDEFGRLVRDDLSDSESDREQYRSRGRSWRNRSRSRSPQENRWRRRSRSPSGRNKHGRYKSSSPARRSRSPVAKRANPSVRHEMGRPRECFDFIKGKCFRGASCRFLHRGSEQQRNRQTRHHEFPKESSNSNSHTATHTRETQTGVSLSRSTDRFNNRGSGDEYIKDDAPGEHGPVRGCHNSAKVLQDSSIKKEELVQTKLENSSISIGAKEEQNSVHDRDGPGQPGSGEISLFEPSQAVASSTSIPDSQNGQMLVQSSQSDLDKAPQPLLNCDQSFASQPSASAPFASVPSSMYPPNQVSSSFGPPPPASSNWSPLPGQPTPMQFHHNAMVSGNVFTQNQMRAYPPPELPHAQPLDFHPRPFQPPVPPFHAVVSENAEASLPFHTLVHSHHQPSYGQQLPSSSFPSATNMAYPSVQRFPSSLPESGAPVPVSDIDLPKSYIRPHYNPYASTFEQTPPSLNIGSSSGQSRVGRSASTIAAITMNPSPVGQLLPKSGIYPRETNAGPVPDVQKWFHAGSVSGAPYDPLFDSIEPSSSSIKKMDLGQEQNLSANDGHNMSKPASLEAESNSKQKGGLVAESETDELGEVATDAEAGAVENVSPDPFDAKDWSPVIPGQIGTDQIRSSERNKKSKDSRSMKLFKIAIADFVKEILKPSWRQGNMSKEAFKTIVKKTVDKVSSSVPSHHIPKTPAKIDQYVESSQRKVTKLVMGYVDKYVKM